MASLTYRNCSKELCKFTWQNKEINSEKSISRENSLGFLKKPSEKWIFKGPGKDGTEIKNKVG